MVIGYYNLWRDILIKSLNIVEKVRNFFFKYFGIQNYNIVSNIWKKKDVLRGKKVFGGFVCVQIKSLILGGKGKDNFMTVSRLLCTKNFQNSLSWFHLKK